MHQWDIDSLLKEMLDRKASDLILTVGTPPQYRVNGILRPAGEHESLIPEITEKLGLALMNEPQLKEFTETRSCDFSYGIAGCSRFRVNVFMQRGSYAIAIRAIPLAIPDFEELGLPPIVEHFALQPRGLLLVTGPAGSGKSTTLAAMIDYINHRRNVHVISIEDPIEYLHRHHCSTIEQREIGGDAPSFHHALRAVFRQTPDVIMIGELRDLESMQLALTLAETGHLILATLHTQDTTHSIHRMVDSFPAHQQQQVYIQLALVLTGVISQQLLITADESKRVLACEVLRVNSAVRNLIREMQVQQIYSVIQTGHHEGMMTMTESLLDLVQRGLVTEDLALERATRPKELTQLMQTEKHKKPGRGKS